MKKLLSVLLALLMVFTLAACSSGEDTADEGGNTAAEEFKVGIILIGDENDGYSGAHVIGINAAAEKLGATVIVKPNAGDGSQINLDFADELIEEGCQLVIENSYGHQSYAAQSAADNPDVTFVAMTGDNAATVGLANLSNGFARIYEARYVAGVVAGMKLQELVNSGKLTEENYDENGKVKIGYVSAFPYAECISGYTAFYLGVRSVYEDVTMLVTYTNNWSSASLESEGAKSLISKGCVIISQHADTTGAPSAVEAAHEEEGKEVYCVGYNISMLQVAPNTALTSATTNWEVAYTYMIQTAMNGENLNDWSAGYVEGAVAITELGSACAEGTAEKVAEVEAAIKNGELHVFDVSTFTVGGEAVTANEQAVDSFFPLTENAIYDGYFHESEFRSAPYFAAHIDGIVDIED